MKPKKLLYWTLCGVMAYNFYGYTKMHTSGDVIAYKRFASAVMKEDSYTARNASDGEVAGIALGSQDVREGMFEGADLVFTRYEIKDRQVSADGKMVTLTADQVSRVNPDGFDTLWGEREVRIRQTIRLVQKHDAWKVMQFDDPAVMKAAAAKR